MCMFVTLKHARKDSALYTDSFIDRNKVHVYAVYFFF